LTATRRMPGGKGSGQRPGALHFDRPGAQNLAPAKLSFLNLSGGSTATLRLPAEAAPNIGARVHNLHLAGWLSAWTFGSNPRDG
jgi:hypothetical protein